MKQTFPWTTWIWHGCYVHRPSGTQKTYFFARLFMTLSISINLPWMPKNWMLSIWKVWSNQWRYYCNDLENLKSEIPSHKGQSDRIRQRASHIAYRHYALWSFSVEPKHIFSYWLHCWSSLPSRWADVVHLLWRFTRAQPWSDWLTLRDSHDSAPWAWCGESCLILP